MSNTALNRSVVAVKTNKSGGAHAQGDVCVEDTSNTNAVVNNTAGAYVNGAIWVCLEPDGVANDALGLYVSMGYVPKINLSSSASLGDFIKTHTVAKQGVRHAAPMVAGDFAQVLGTGTNPAAWMFGAPYQGTGAAGSPTTAEYVTTAADGTLSAEVNIPGLAGSADRAGIGGGGSGDKEFDDTTDPFTWGSAPATHDSDTSIPSHLYLKQTANDTRTGTYAWSPTGAYQLIAKLSLGVDAYATACNAKLLIADGTNIASINGFGVQLAVQSTANAPMRIVSVTYASGTPTNRTTIEFRSNEVYVKLVNDGSNNVSVYFSNNGLVWWHMSTNAVTFTASQIMIALVGAASQVVHVAVDFIRTQD